jgi:hypothetical protein
MLGSKNVNFSREELMLSDNGQYQADPLCKCLNEQITYQLAFFFFRVQLPFVFCMLRNRGMILSQYYRIRRNEEYTDDVN